jgi:predicted amidohydrolase YtcJ
MTSILFTGGLVRTGLPGETAEWVLVGGDTIAGVGNGDGPRAERTVDLEGGTLIPAFRDAHVHLPATGLYELGLDFRGESSAQALLDAFAGRARLGGDAVLFGGNFEDPLDRSINGADLDAAVGDRKALLMRADMHSCIVSSALRDELELVDVPGVDRDDIGRATGYLREQAAAEAYRWFEVAMPKQQQIDAIRAAVTKAYSKGIAEVHEMFVVEWRGWGSTELLEEAIREVALDVAPFLGTTEVTRVKTLGFPRIGGDWFLDGSFGSHTAWLSRPYLGDVPAGSTPTGIAYRSDDEVYDFFREAQAADLQVAVHAIGDAAIEQCIGAWEKVAAEAGVVEVKAKGHRIEHFECATDDHIGRAARLGLRASVQPAFDHYWGGDSELYARRMGAERALGMNRFNSMLRAGLSLAAGSDSTVTPLDPFLQMFSLREHHVADERLDAETALRLHTVGPAAINGHSHLKGTIETGLQADLALLDRDPIATESSEVLETSVLGTWIAGRRVWPREEADVR